MWTSGFARSLSLCFGRVGSERGYANSVEQFHPLGTRKESRRTCFDNAWSL